MVHGNFDLRRSRSFSEFELHVYNDACERERIIPVGRNLYSHRDFYSGVQANEQNSSLIEVQRNMRTFQIMLLFCLEVSRPLGSN